MRRDEQLAVDAAVQHWGHGGYALEVQVRVGGAGDLMVPSCRAHRAGECDRPRSALQLAATRTAVPKRDD